MTTSTKELTDKELLELAAQAVGLTIDKSPNNGGGYWNTGFDLAGNLVLDWHNNKTWNPLHNDGDALRLAVKLGIDVLQLEKSKSAYANNSQVVYSDAADPYAATRRAITRAAASIGAKNVKT
jgi:hypothetical protein